MSELRARGIADGSIVPAELVHDLRGETFIARHNLRFLPLVGPVLPLPPRLRPRPVVPQRPLELPERDVFAPYYDPDAIEDERRRAARIASERRPARAP